MASPLDVLNDEQKKAATHGSGPLLIVAGAGTGKTTVIANRIAWLIMEQKIPADNILALTFTDKAAGEMEERVDQILPLGYVDLWISTFHSFCERLLKAHALDIGLPAEFKILDETDQALLMREHFDEFELDYYRPLGNPTKFIQALLTHFSRAKDEGITAEDYLAYAQKTQLDADQVDFDAGDAATERMRLHEVAKAYHAYQRLLLKNGALDFGDLLLYTLQLFKERPAILAMYQKQFQYLLVDEFQDTNHAQYEIVQLLAAPKNNITVVGDDDQSIYKFRGAAISNIVEFTKDYPHLTQIVLTNNYRSKQNILDLSYGFIQQNNPHRLEIVLGQNGSTKISKQLHAHRADPAEIKHIHARTQEEEARLVIQKIVDLKQKNADATWSDFAILVRANDHANIFLSMLERSEIPYQFLASRGLYQQPVVLDLIALLQASNNYHDSKALYRVIGMPHWGLPLSDTMLLLDEAKKSSRPLFFVLEKAGAVKGITASSVPIVLKILSLLKTLSASATQESVGVTALKALKESGYLAYCTEKNDDPQSSQKVLFLTSFFKHIQRFEEAHTSARIHDFLNELVVSQELGESGSLNQTWDQGPETVKVLTVHGAKGLEFKYVFIVSLVDKRFPSIERRETIPLPEALVKEIITEGDVHLEEERRLFYVALTRARDGLYLTSAEDYGGMRKKKASRFLTELGFIPKLEESTAAPFDIPTHEQKISDELKLLRSRIPKQFSFTQFQAFESCPKQYKYAHLLNVPITGRHTFSFGKSMHATVFKFFSEFREGKKAGFQQSVFEERSKESVAHFPTWERLLEIFDESWINEWYQDQRHEQVAKAKAREQLKMFYEYHSTRMPDIRALEQPFTLRIGDHRIKGVIDRIDGSGTGVHIVDYKTGSAPKEGKRLSLEDKWQLYLYSRAVRDVLQLEPLSLSFYFFEKGEYTTFQWDPKEEAKILEKTETVIDSILQSSFTATPAAFTCKNCDFRDICEDRVV